MRVLIVGCGYVGTALGVELMRLGHQVSGVRRSREGVAEVRTSGMEPIQADVSEATGCRGLPGSFDWIVNTVSAGRTGLDSYRKVYLEGTRNLIDRFGAELPAKYVYTSSTGVYGQQDGSSVTEQSPTEPCHDTGNVLVETEQMLSTAFQEKTFPAVTLRVAGIYGPGRGYWLRRFLNDQARQEDGGGRAVNMIHREDLVSAIIAALERATPGQVYNVVDNHPTTVPEIYAWLSQTTGRPLPPTSGVPEPVGGTRMTTHKRVSNRKLIETLNWQPKYPSFREGYSAELATAGCISKK